MCVLLHEVYSFIDRRLLSDASIYEYMRAHVWLLHTYVLWMNAHYFVHLLDITSSFFWTNECARAIATATRVTLWQVWLMTILYTNQLSFKFSLSAREQSSGSFKSVAQRKKLSRCRGKRGQTSVYIESQAGSTIQANT